MGGLINFAIVISSLASGVALGMDISVSRLVRPQLWSRLKGINTYDFQHVVQTTSILV